MPWQLTGISGVSGHHRVEDLESDLGTVIDNGCEVGLHGGYYAFDDLAEIKLEKARLEKVLEKK